MVVNPDSCMLVNVNGQSLIILILDLLQIKDYKIPEFFFFFRVASNPHYKKRQDEDEKIFFYFPSLFFPFSFFFFFNYIPIQECMY